MYEPLTIIQLAKKFSFSTVFQKPDNKLLRFKRDDVMVDVWYSTMTVGFYHNGTARYVKNVDYNDLPEVFSNPELYV